MFFVVTALLGVLCVETISPAHADTPLFIGCPEYDYNNGKPCWEIKERGNYYLDIDGSAFSTNNFFVIRIYASNVVLDGKGKTLTASGPIVTERPKENICGVMVNGGPMVQNVTIKNLNVEKKFYGILFEWHNGGKVENCKLTGNVRGITLWNADHMTLSSNTANNNTEYGIEFDADETELFPYVNNTYNSLTNNIASNNGLGGIILHLENSYNDIVGNTCNGNGHFGITLPDGSHDNTLSDNTTSDNPAGILISKSYSNVIKGNTITRNRHQGVWLYSATNNTIFNNYFNNLDKDISFDGTCSGNQWNTSKTAGTNIVGGPYLGGNFWATPEGDGFSQTHADNNGDGICDSAYAIAGNNVDQLPLHAYTVRITLPEVTTSAVSSLTCNTASSGGNVTSSGNAAITARGICWSKSENPSINDSHTSDGTGTGSFQSTITGLDLGATYYVRAYATNSAGTGYGQDLPFDTPPFEGIAYVSSSDVTCGGHCPCYTTLQSAIDAPYDARTIKVAGGTYNEAVTLNDSRTIVVEGGWDTAFTSQPACSTIKSPTVNSGSLSFRNLSIMP